MIEERFCLVEINFIILQRFTVSVGAGVRRARATE